MTNLRTYWDLSERDRAQLSREDVERYADVELMTKGVLRVEAPTLEPMPTVPDPDREVFTVSRSGSGKPDFCFATAEQARAFVDLKPIHRTHHYVDGMWIDYLEAETEWKISAERAVSEALATLHRNDFFRAKEVKARNERVTEAYQKAVKDQQEALSSMWNDWHAQQRKARELKRVVDTLESYTATAEGDRSVAFRFLRKVFTDDQIIAAVEWFEFPVPAPFVVHHGGPNADRGSGWIDEIAGAPAEPTPSAEVALF